MTTAKKKVRVPLASMPAFGPRELSGIREVMQEAAKLFGPRTEQLIFERDRLKIEAEYNMRRCVVEEQRVKIDQQRANNETRQLELDERRIALAENQFKQRPGGSGDA